MRDVLTAAGTLADRLQLIAAFWSGVCGSPYAEIFLDLDFQVPISQTHLYNEREPVVRESRARRNDSETTRAAVSSRTRRKTSRPTDSDSRLLSPFCWAKRHTVPTLWLASRDQYLEESRADTGAVHFERATPVSENGLRPRVGWPSDPAGMLVFAGSVKRTYRNVPVLISTFLIPRSVVVSTYHVETGAGLAPFPHPHRAGCAARLFSPLHFC